MEKRVVFDASQNCILINVHPGYVYDIDMERCKTAGAALDWIHQVCIGKTWGPEICSEFLSVLFDLIPIKLWSGKA